jgi:uridine kinase
MITPAPGEPAVTSWRQVQPDDLVADLLDRLGPGRRVVAVDGRGGSGKTTLARRLASRLADAAMVSTDDVAWYESMFGWSDLLVAGVLRPFRAGSAVAFRPPAWARRGREGAITVAPSVRVLIIEGVGASRRELSPWLDAAVWVQSDYAEAERRGIARDIADGQNGDAEATIAFWHTWQAEELPFLDRDRPWERADLVVAGTSPSITGDGDIAIGRWQHG